MSLTVGFGCECKVAHKALERPFTIVGSQVAYQGAFVCTGVATEVALVWGKTQVGTNMTCRNNQTGGYWVHVVRAVTVNQGRFSDCPAFRNTSIPLQDL